ncbi:DUF3466 family protein [Limnofasciculus baicalensis]|uniref:DUF3466 family protein n=1 Tax=Limnofasciculus baicalensis BBK-W-15 TaxID=2699891 RepID=A0AAE3KNT9_9CYAN|nr:DUF3466 family protein [Limnofasciculus baicalensis]MCP2730171.1 DUF3466 family protein [Limnofasciculus baicalensis BBK-W-15]
MLQNKFSRLGLALTVSATLGLVNSNSATAASFKQYQAIDLGTLNNSPTVTGAAINDVSQIVGRYNSASINGFNTGFIWENGVMTGLPLTGFKVGGPNDGATVTMPGRGGLSRSINNSGKIVGAGDELPGSTDRGLLWAPDATDGYDLTIYEFGGVESYFVDINNKDQIAGSHIYAPGKRDAIHWENGHRTYLPSLGGDLNLGVAINDSGKIVGYLDTDGADNGTNTYSGALWEKDANGNYILTNLGTNGATQSFAREINSVGQVVGQLVNGTGSTATTSPFLWQNNAFTLLGSLGGTKGDVANINKEGQVVGYSTNTSNQELAFIWHDGAIADLNTLLTNNLLVDGANVVLNRATGINNKGDIVAYGNYSYTDAQGLTKTGTRTYLLKSVPEGNTTVGLLAFGAVGVAYQLKRKGQKVTKVK